MMRFVEKLLPVDEMGVAEFAHNSATQAWADQRQF